VDDAGGDARSIRHSDAMDPRTCLGADRVAPRLYLRAGRLWLSWTVCGLRTLSLVLNFVCTPNLNYREITGLLHVSFLGKQSPSPRGFRTLGC
jgi:hypothetical protein